MTASNMRSMAAILLSWWLLMFVEGSEHIERHPNDGWYNNLQHPDWGAIDTILIRKSPPAYSDGSYEPSGTSRPNPLEISSVAFKGSDDLGSLRNRNALLVYFGQQLVEEIVDAQRPGCPREYFNIKVPKDHPYNPHGFDNLHMPFLRTRYDQRTGYSPNNPRQQLNEITPYIDGNLFYGAGKAWEDALRSFKDGLLLATSDDVTNSFPVENDIRLPFANPPIPRDHILRPVSRFRRYGNPRTHENPFLNALGVVWFRYHNYIAGKIKERQPTWNDEQLFNAARKRVIAQYQKIVMYEWLPAWLKVEEDGDIVNLRKTHPYYGGQNSKYNGYEPTLHPGITVEFQSAAMRYGHTLVPSRVITQAIEFNSCVIKRRRVAIRHTNDTGNADTDSTVEGIRLCNSFWVPEETLEDPKHDLDVSSVILGMVYTKAGREDNVIVSDIRENTFGPLEWSRRDLGALNIQRGRDHGLPGYNEVRKAYGLPKNKVWEDISRRPEVQSALSNLSQLQKLYGRDSVDDLDVFVGGLLETTEDGPGELFYNIILEQFLRIRHADRFWYENRDNNLFSDKEVDEIEATNFHDVLEVVLSSSPGGRRDNTFVCEKPPFFANCRCHEPIANGPGVYETCEPLHHYDYFTGSGAAYVATTISLIAAITIACAILWYAARKRHKESAHRQNEAETPKPPKSNQFYASEWVGNTSCGHLNKREVLVDLNVERLKIFVVNYVGQVIRMIDVRKRPKWTNDQCKVHMTTSCDKGYRLLVVNIPGEIDLVLHFPTQHGRDIATDKLERFFKLKFWEVVYCQPSQEHTMWKQATTADQRKENLARFFRGILQAISKTQKNEDGPSSKQVDCEVAMTKLTRTEFADALGLQPQSLFVRNMFILADTDGEGFISFDEFKCYFGILYSGTQNQKAEMFFKMFDTSRDGKLTKENYKKMIKSLWEMNETRGGSNSQDLDNMVNAIFEGAGLSNQGYMSLADFQSIFFADTSDVWKNAVLNMELNGQSMSNVPMSTRSTTPVFQRAKTCFAEYRKASIARQLSGVTRRFHTEPKVPVKGRVATAYAKLTRYIDNHWRQIFWLSLYMSLTLGIFIERFFYFSFEREHAGLRRITGYGVSITRGAASAQMFTFASLMVTMCRNTFTFLRDTFLHRFIPFDSAYDMHSIAGWTAVFFTVVHIIGHMVNFYQISTQPSTDMNCYFREFFRSSDTLASFQYWLFGTITGFTGYILTLALIVIVVFAVPYSRRNVFNLFAFTHKKYYIIYILMFLHGGGRVVQEPFWAYFFLGPMVLYLFDRMISVSRVKLEIPVKEATILPSDVINLVFKRPLTFNYRSGQWVRISCKELCENEYHPFTLTSAPHEEHLSLHIRAVGPWTNNLRTLFKQNIPSRKITLSVDGPFGESHQDWSKFPVSILIGGGIGITPFASILKDIAYSHRNATTGRIPCKKVYFIWVTRTQRSFEWMTDILQQVEAADMEDFVEIHICITQMKNKFDLRTAILYICERHFQKIAGMSMFTGLQAKTHFGRPKFKHFFEGLKSEYHDVQQIGVFSCGPPGMTRSVKNACAEVNSVSGPSLINHYENF